MPWAFMEEQRTPYFLHLIQGRDKLWNQFFILLSYYNFASFNETQSIIKKMLDAHYVPSILWGFMGN